MRHWLESEEDRREGRKSISSGLMNMLPMCITKTDCTDFKMPQNSTPCPYLSEGRGNWVCVSTTLACHWLRTASNNINFLAPLMCLMMLLENTSVTRDSSQAACCKCLQDKFIGVYGVPECQGDLRSQPHLLPVTKFA